MNTELINVLDQLAERFGLAVDWSSQNVLPYVQQLAEKIVRYRAVSAVENLLIGIAAIAAAVLLFKLARKHRVKYEEDGADADEILMLLCPIGCGVAAIFGVCTIIGSIDTLVKCCVFPEALIIDYVREMTKVAAQQ